MIAQLVTLTLSFEEWLVWREIYFAHRQTTFTAWLLVDSHSLHPHTHPYHHQAAPKKVVKARGLKQEPEGRNQKS
jgi:hypothetical protein